MTEEIRRVLRHGQSKGAGLRHLACALYLVGEPAGAAFLSLDVRQAAIAKRLGFRT